MSDSVSYVEFELQAMQARATAAATGGEIVLPESVTQNESSTETVDETPKFEMGPSTRLLGDDYEAAASIKNPTAWMRGVLRRIERERNWSSSLRNLKIIELESRKF